MYCRMGKKEGGTCKDVRTRTRDELIGKMCAQLRHKVTTRAVFCKSSTIEGERERSFWLANKERESQSKTFGPVLTFCTAVSLDKNSVSVCLSTLWRADISLFVGCFLLNFVECRFCKLFCLLLVRVLKRIKVPRAFVKWLSSVRTCVYSLRQNTESILRPLIPYSFPKTPNQGVWKWTRVFV